MNSRRTDVIWGLFSLLAAFICGLVFLSTNAVLNFLLAWTMGGIVIWLWNGGTIIGRVIAAVAVPGVFLQYMMPKKIRSAVNALPHEDHDSGQ